MQYFSDKMNKLQSLASKREHVTPKHALIGCQMWHDWSSHIWSLADRNTNFHILKDSKSLAPADISWLY